MSRFWRVSIWATVAACVALAAMAGGAGAKPPSKGAGQLDKSFGKGGLLTLSRPAGTTQVTTTTPGGSIFIAESGSVTSLDADGSSDQSFGTNGRITLTVPAGYKFEPAAVAVDSKGRVLVAGTTVSTAGSPGRAADGWWIPIPATATVYRFLPNGSPDPTFGEDGVTRTSLNQELPDMSLRPGEKLSANMALAGEAGGGGNAMTVTGMALTSEDRPVLALHVPKELVTCRDFGYPVFDQRTLLAGVTTTGSVDSGFGTDGVTEVAGEKPVGPVALRGGGVAVATDPERLCSEGSGGLPYSLNVVGPKGALRADVPIGGRVTTFTMESTTHALAVDGRGRILTLTTVAGSTVSDKVRRYFPDGAPDKSYGSHGVAVLKGKTRLESPSLAVDGAGRALVEQGSPGEAPHSLVVQRLTAAGGRDPSFGRGGKAGVRFSQALDRQGLAVFTGAHDEVTAIDRVACQSGETCGVAVARLRGR